MKDYGVVFLACARKESRNVDKRNQRNVEGVAEAYEAGCLARCVAVEHSGEEFRLVGNDTYRLSVEAGETDDDVLRIVALHFEELAVVDDCAYDLIHVVCLVWRVGHDFVQSVFHAVDRVCALYERSLFEVVLRDVAEEFADELQCLFSVFSSEVCHT